MSHSKPKAVVIGGGVIGSSIAYHLAKEKVRVVLLEKSDLASGSSGACDGLVLMQTKKPGIHLRLAMESKKRFEQLKNQLPVSIEYENNGCMVVIETETERQIMNQSVKKQRDVGLDVSLLDSDQAREIVPQVSEHIKGAAYSPLDSQVNPIALTHGLALGAKQLGAEVVTHAAVRDIRLAGDRVQAVVTDQGRFKADFIVNAAGVYAPQIGEMINLQIPIRPRRGQILVTEAARPMLKCCLISASYIAAKFNPDLAKREGQGISADQTASGNFLLGSTREFVGFDNRTTPAGLQKIAQGISKILPCLKQLHIIRTFAGLRPYTPDGLPILGAVDAVDGFIMAAGHEGDGISLSLITGELIAQLIVDGRTSFPLADFKLERFSRTNSNVGENDAKPAD